MKIYVAPGHGIMPSGAFDPGATSGHEVEHTLAHAIVAAYATALRRNGWTVVEETEPDPDYIGSVARANAAGVNCGDEVHFNAGGGHGVEVEVHPATSDANFACAGRMCRLISEATGLPNRGPVERTGLYWLNATNFPALLPEIAFVDADQAIIDRPGFAVRVGEALAHARCEYAGMTYHPPAVSMNTGMIITTIGGTFVAAEVTSPDGVTWTRAEDWTAPPDPPEGTADTGTVVTTIDGQFVAANAGSGDGETWQRYEDFA